MKKYILSLLLFFISSVQIYASPISKFVNKYDLGNKSVNGIYVKDINTNEVVYEKNSRKMHNPASTLKTLVVGSSYIVLGEDFNFKTSLYKDKNDIYIKLGLDVMLSQSDLNTLFAELKKQYPNIQLENVYMDASVIENVGYPASWLDDDKWPIQREITPFVIDNNYFKIDIKRSSLATKVDIIQNDDYKLPIVNELELGDKNNYVIERPYDKDSSIIQIKGTIAQDETLKLPVLKPEINFAIKIKNAIAKNKLVYTKNPSLKVVPQNAIEVKAIERNIKDVIKYTLATSDNLASELIFRAAAAKHISYSRPATFADAVSMFNSVFGDELANDIKIADGCGISHENFISCEKLCDCLLKLFEQSNFRTLMAQPSEGTLSTRLLFLTDNLKAKTGTLSHASALLGTMTTKQGKDVVFCIITHNSSKRKAIIKNFENRLVGLIYRKY